ncbi:hypothetical protein LGR54_22035 [Ancylobacter sp. Lp-2]|uniref:hypothetical protein n=1 Tax=Ancylobacter sp. Lp-2 TaxID=2881339 RepID=UPI001E4B8286|nr:hypothetical protein [Ancylobacter sp. Lp-2]MCB4771293.1 hypothetical protein [Ancylobacter sp. Lp-2]
MPVIAGGPARRRESGLGFGFSFGASDLVPGIDKLSATVARQISSGWFAPERRALMRRGSYRGSTP